MRSFLRLSQVDSRFDWIDGHTPVIGNGVTILGPVSGWRKQAFSYILEDACIRFGHLTNIRPERNPRLVEQLVQQPKDLSPKEGAYSTYVMEEYNAGYAEDIPASTQAGEYDISYDTFLCSSWF